MLQSKDNAALVTGTQSTGKLDKKKNQIRISFHLFSK